MNGSGIGKVLKLFRKAGIGIASDPDKGGTVIFASVAVAGGFQNLRVAEMIRFDRDPTSSTKFVAAVSVVPLSGSIQVIAKRAGKSSLTTRRSPGKVAVSPAAKKAMRAHKHLKSDALSKSKPGNAKAKKGASGGKGLGRSKSVKKKPAFKKGRS